VLAFCALLATLLAGAQRPERIVEIRVHGNALTGCGDIQLADVSVGMTIEATTFECRGTASSIAGLRTSRS
jgi:hypothetical protein